MIVIIPAFNPDENLIKIVENLERAGIGKQQILVVNDGSLAQCEPIFSSIREKVLLLAHEKNRGKGEALKTGMGYVQKQLEEGHLSKFTPLVFMDADGQHRVEDVQKVGEAVLNRPDCLVLGCRHVGKEMPVKSRLGNWLTRMIFRGLTGQYVSDTQTGLRGLTVQHIPFLLSIPGSKYDYEMNMLTAWIKSGWPIYEVPIQTLYLDRKNSVSHFRKVQDSFLIYKDLFKFSGASFLSFLVDFSVFSLLILLAGKRSEGDLSSIITLGCNVGARLVSGTANFYMNQHWVFRSSQRIGKSGFQYFLLAMGVLAANSLLLLVITSILNIPPLPAKVLVELLLFLVSFWVQKKIIFKK